MIEKRLGIQFNVVRGANTYQINIPYGVPVDEAMEVLLEVQQDMLASKRAQEAALAEQAANAAIPKEEPVVEDVAN